jgi:molybdopterin-synthase adenylyltransferase
MAWIEYLVPGVITIGLIAFVLLYYRRFAISKKTGAGLQKYSDSTSNSYTEIHSKKELSDTGLASNFTILYRSQRTNKESFKLNSLPTLYEPIWRPTNVKVYYRQKICAVCGQSIDMSYHRTGWARCLATNKLVHGHCYTYAARHTSIPNWCAVCGGPCTSGSAMRIEGIEFDHEKIGKVNMTVPDKITFRHEQKLIESATNRQERISGWSQERLEQGRVLILGAGAIGNEAVKNLALMGLGYMLVADMDYVDRSNLSRAILFQENDVQQHRSKADVVAKRAQLINVTPHAFVQSFHGDIVWQLGGGVFRRVDVVLGCLDNIEARIRANANCLFTGKPYLDGGILGLAGNLTAVHPPFTACWECTTSQRERELISNRYDSCSNVMRRDIEAGRLPTIQVASSIIAGFQTQEAVKIIQGKPWAAGYIIQYDASLSRPDLDVLAISRRPNCWCNYAEVVKNIIELPLSARNNTLRDLRDSLVQLGHADPRIALPDQFVVMRNCLKCSHQTPIMQPRFRLDTTVLVCPFCRAEGNEWINLVTIGQIDSKGLEAMEKGDKISEQIMNLPLLEVGFPELALVLFSSQEKAVNFEMMAELSADAVHVMGGDQYSEVRSSM